MLMRVKAYPAHSCYWFSFNAMFVALPHCFMSTFSSSAFCKSHFTPSTEPIKFKNPSLRQICKRGNLKEAFQSLITSFFAEHTSFASWPDEGYAPILELCATHRAIQQGKQIHGHMVKYCDLSDSVFLSTKLVFFYGKCGFVVDAEKVFDRMCERTIFTWNAILGAYVSNNDPFGCLGMFREMRVFGVSLDSCSFPVVLKACALVRDIRYGKQVHGLIAKSGYDSVVFVANSLVGMYAKCDELNGARRLFEWMHEKGDVVSWNSMISAYSANQQSIEALDLFRKMQNVHVNANSYTFVAALQACDNETSKKQGMEIHSAILKSSHFIDVYVSNALLDMYARFGRMREAAGIFNKMNEKDSVSWNTMLSGFIQNGLHEEAVEFFHYMQDIGKKPDQISVISILAACGRLGYILNGMEVHAYAIKHGHDSNLQVGNTVMDMYTKCCHVNYMGRTFDKMPDKDYISWTTIVAGYAQNNSPIKALRMFRKAQMEGIGMDSMVIGSILLACSGLQSLVSVREIHGYIVRRELLDIMLENKVLNAYSECGKLDYAIQMFGSIKDKDIVSWTSMISSYVHNGLANEALESFNLMIESNLEPDYVTLVSILSAVASLSMLKKGKEIHNFIIRKGLLLEGPIANALLDMYACCGSLVNACKIFNGIDHKSIVLCTSMINAYGMHGYGQAAIELFYRMKSDKVKFDHIAFLAILYACSHSGLVDEGRDFFEMMKTEYHLKPWAEHYACLVDLLGRANRLVEAYSVVKAMEIEPTAEVWCALLGASKVYSNKEIGEIATKKLLEMNPKKAGNYVLISNVFAASAKWKDVEKVRTRMKGEGLKKNPGCSWIEIGNKVHTFMARDKSHGESEKIYEKLAQVMKKLENEGGYKAETKFVLHNVDEDEKIKMIHGHSEKLAIAYALLHASERTAIRISKNLRVCGDCHTFCKLVSRLYERELVVRDASRFHHFKNGVCSCQDFW